MPSNPELYSEQELPTHPMLQLLDNSEQILTGRYSRRLITMVKICPYDAAVAAEWRQQREGYVMALERLSELVYAGTKEEAAAIAAAAATAGSGSSEAGEQQQQQQVVMLSGIPKYRGKNC
jgi:tRNA (guanine10-N2)-methyltransferase